MVESRRSVADFLLSSSTRIRETSGEPLLMLKAAICREGCRRVTLMANREKIIAHSGSSLKKFLPTYFSKIQRHCESSTLSISNYSSQLSPHDLYRKWNSGSRKDKELSSVVMNIAPSVVSVSTLAGAKRKIDCSGLIIDWDDSNDCCAAVKWKNSSG